MIRHAIPGDLPALVELESACFAGDRLSRRSLRHMISHAHADLLVDGRLRGYVLVTYRSGSGVARLYSLAVEPGSRGAGLGRALVRAAESCAAGHGCTTMRLELRADNGPARGLYAAQGYRQSGCIRGYYEDGMDAVRMEKAIG